MVILQLEDNPLAPTGEDVFGGVQLTAIVRCRVDESAVRRPGLPLRLEPDHVLFPKDPSQ